MSDHVRCPECDEEIAVTADDRRKGLKCPTCGAEVIAPKEREKSRPVREPRRERPREPARSNPPSTYLIGAIVVLVLLGVVVWVGYEGVRWARGLFDRNKAAALNHSAAPNPADASFPPAVPPFAADPALAGPNRSVYLADMTEFGVQLGPWAFGKGELGDGKQTPIRLKDRLYPKGLSVHPWERQSTRVCYALGGQAKTLRGGVGLNDHEHEAHGPVMFAVFGDGKELWRSPPINRASGPVWFELDVRGVKVLDLRASSQGGYWAAHAVWLDPLLEK
ncbi:MAG TPA: NPCBM/NEW2 domain-containing protein [Gemmataceae bacterium]|nr:NPCBM/NEW2 domain-containing protein [Gemmataceae bacterium]